MSGIRTLELPDRRNEDTIQFYPLHTFWNNSPVPCVQITPAGSSIRPTDKNPLQQKFCIPIP
ncbi:hypothetical protein T265_06147 [Opisthorchis viverrini]|uniref:Uncharacterized protein n=1 Tax=Opisthorchis viverrini TaxID=6198 RepID=A0A074ZTF7_OPIVI|nr:hypothetical protein T265_06147 [Opisthorchis viverrini]KER26645.1 hypothetical protein T265_06147 [Opisthorchis viverrini]